MRFAKLCSTIKKIYEGFFKKIIAVSVRFWFKRSLLLKSLEGF